MFFVQNVYNRYDILVKTPKVEKIIDSTLTKVYISVYNLYCIVMSKSIPNFKKIIKGGNYEKEIT